MINQLKAKIFSAFIRNFDQDKLFQKKSFIILLLTVDYKKFIVLISMISSEESD